MSPYGKRRLIDFAINMAITMALSVAGAGWWALLTTPLAIWNYYDGATRATLSRDSKRGSIALLKK